MRLVSEGVEAIKRGDKQAGIDLLIRVTEADPRNEQAWLWLSVAVDSPEDKLVALENVLAVNPNNIAARDQARRWRQKISGEAPPSEPAVFLAAGPPVPADPITAVVARQPPRLQTEALAGYAPAVPLEEADDVDDPYQCAYCGRPTKPEDRNCPHCGRSLMVTRPATKRASSVLRTANFFVGLLFATSLFEILPPLIAKFVADGASPIPYRFLLREPGADLLLGQFLNWSGAIATALLTIAVARAAIMLILTIGLFARSSIVFRSATLALILDVLWNFYRGAAGYVGPAAAIVDVVMAFAGLAMLFAADRDFEVLRTRLIVQPDPHLRGAAAFYKAGHAYRKQGMWALAVAQWRQAVGAQPREVLYYKDLGVGYAQINRFERSLRALEEAARQAADDPELPEMIALVNARREKVGEEEIAYDRHP